MQAALTGVTAAVVGVIANLATFGVLRRFAVQTYYLVPVGAVLGMAWVLLGTR